MLNSVLGVIAAVLAASAMGAIWSLAALWTTSRTPWMALVAAFALVALLRFNGHSASMARGLSAMLLTGLSIAHANYLMAAGFIGAQMSMPFVDLLLRMGAEMAIAVSRAHAAPFEGLFYILALVAAGLLGWRMPGEVLHKATQRRRRAGST